MDKEEYKKLVKYYKPKEKKIKNFFVSFLVGGLIGFIGEIIVDICMKIFALPEVYSYAILVLIIIGFGSLFTALGFFDTWVTKIKCGLIIPTTGFAHSVASSALDYKKDGLITGLGANFFKLAGSVILYGIISSFILVIVRVIIGV